jgi:hypothetical protein
MTNRERYTPTFSMQISLGNVITICGGLIALTTAWNNLDSRVQANQLKGIEAIAKIDAQALFDTRIADRIRANEGAIIRQDERMKNILEGLDRIERQLTGIRSQIDGDAMPNPRWSAP